MKRVSSLVALIALTGASQSPQKIGLKCVGDNVDPKTYAPYPNQRFTQHWVLDFGHKSIYFRDPVSGKLSWTYHLRTEPTRYSGEALKDYTYNGLYHHSYDTIYFDRTDGRVESHGNSVVSPKDQPAKLTFGPELVWIGHCEREAPDHREPLKF